MAEREIEKCIDELRNTIRKYVMLTRFVEQTFKI